MNKNLKDIDIANTKIGVVGAGSWGTSLAKLLADKGFLLDLWVYEKEVKEQIENERQNRLFLPDVILPRGITPSNDLETVVKGKELVLVVVPSHCMREVAGNMNGLVSDHTIVVSASKGIENKTHLTMLKILREKIENLDDDHLGVLSGPSFAKEVANQVPTVVAVASSDPETGRYVQKVFSSPCFRVYVNDDPVGVEIGGAVKNVIALAAGICDGMGLGYNARAALITRGLTEMKRLGTQLGADPLTLAGLAGVGDLMLTCTGELSRNYTVGKKIGKGQKIEAIISEMRMVAEGVKTTRSVYNLSKKIGVELPICNEVYYVLFEGLDVNLSIERLMNRDLKHELEGVIF